MADVDEVSLPRGPTFGCEEVHAVFAIDFGPSAPGGISPFFSGEVLYKRQGTDGTWTPFTTLSGGLAGTFSPARPFRFNRVSLTGVNADLHLCAVTINPNRYTNVAAPGLLLHSVRHFNANTEASGQELGQWVGWDDVGAVASGTPKTIIDVGCAGLSNPGTGKDDLHVCVVADDGRLLHSIQDGVSAVWTPFGDVGTQAGNAGPFTRVDCAAQGNQLYVVAVTNSGRALFTIRGATSWRLFEDVQNAASFPLSQFDRVTDVAVGFYNAGLPTGQSQLYVVAAMYVPSGLAYTVRSSQPIAWQTAIPGGPRQWKPWANLETETGYTDGGSFSSASVGARPRLP